MPSSFTRPTSPPIRPFRFSSQRDHDVRPKSHLHTPFAQHLSSPQISSNRPVSVIRRGSRIPELIAGGLRRSRTTSLPPRPRSEEGPSDLVRINPKPDTDSVASSSFASGKHHPYILLPTFHVPILHPPSRASDPVFHSNLSFTFFHPRNSNAPFVFNVPGIPSTMRFPDKSL